MRATFMDEHAPARFFLRRYADSIPLVSRSSSAIVAWLGLFLAFACTAYGARQAIRKWGETPQIVSPESRLSGSSLLSGLWYSPTGELYGYQQDGWKVTFLQWSSVTSSVPVSAELDLSTLTPLDNEAGNGKTPALSSSGRSEATYRRLQKNAVQQFPFGSATSSQSVVGSTTSTNWTATTPLVAVSQDLSGIVWAWQGKLYMTVRGKESSAELHSWQKALSQIKIGDLVGVHLVSGAMILQDAQRISLYDLNEHKSIRSFNAAAPCVVDVSGTRALLVCPSLSSLELSVLDFSSLPKVEQQTFHVTAQDVRSSRLTAVALARDGTPAVATDLGNIVYWPSNGSGKRTSQELNSPGVAQSLECDGHSVVVGGGFRGIYQLQEGAAPKLLVSDVTGTTSLALKNLESTSEGLDGGTLAFGTREGASIASLREVRPLNNLGYMIATSWVGFWALYLLVVPVATVWIDENRRTRDLRLRTEMELSLTRVPNGSETSETLPLPDPPEELIQSCADGDCVAFVGAGMGAQAGLPTWRPFIQSLLTEVSKRKLLDTTQSRSFQEAFVEGQTDVVADGLVNSLRGRENVLYELLSSTFLPQDTRPTRAHTLLRSLNLCAVLTTNFDNLLDTTFSDRIEAVYTPQDADKLLAALTKRQFFLLKLYGALDRTDSVLLAPFQYIEAMARNLLFSRFMESLFSSRTLLFVGASLEGIEAYLTGIRFPTSMPQKHFALVATLGGAWRVKADLLARRFGIQVLGFTPQPGYPEIEQFLAKLSAAIQAKGTRTDAETARGVSRLRRVTLENIGPFYHVDLELNGNWNILLGDNGVGKSTILKAIAVGICGEDAKDYAARLVRSGRTSATITLETDRGKKYISTILSKGQIAEVTTQPSKPLEAEGWLALGFPPLRTFTWVRDKEFSLAGQANREDMLPLARGESDPRLDTLKAWFVDLDHLIKDARSQQTNPSRAAKNIYEELRDDFFKVIEEITPGLKIEFQDVNPRTKEVTIMTDDGAVPIESVSQGTTSLLGWVGILMQRLYDVYGRNNGLEGRPQTDSKSGIPPRERYALILVDEIDAHMHPSWQRQIVHHLSKLFPNAQFIATTHSPLIVGGMLSQQVRRFVRDDDGKVVQLPVDQDWLMGRADQVLTTQLFGMKTTVDPRTEERIDEYKGLLGKTSRTKEEETRFQELRRILRFRIPMSSETPVERRAQELLRALLQEQLGEQSVEAQQLLLQRAEELITELQSERRSKA